MIPYGVSLNLKITEKYLWTSAWTGFSLWILGPNVFKLYEKNGEKTVMQGKTFENYRKRYLPRGSNDTVKLDSVVSLTPRSLTLGAVNDTTESDSWCCQWHHGVWLGAVNDTTESDSVLSMTPRSLTRCCQWHRGIFAHANIPGKWKPNTNIIQHMNIGPIYCRGEKIRKKTRIKNLLTLSF